MKDIAAALLVLSGTGAIAAPSRPHVQYFPAPALQGRPAAWSSAVRVGDVLYLAGQIGIGPDGKLAETFEGQAKQTMENVGAMLKAHGLGWGDVVKCTVFVADMKNWPAFNAVYVPYFPSGRLPAPKRRRGHRTLRRRAGGAGMHGVCREELASTLPAVQMNQSRSK